MMMTMSKRVLGAFSFACATAGVVGCSSGSAASSSAGVTAGDGGATNYLALVVGTRWTYNVTRTSAGSGQGTVAVEAQDTAPMSGQSGLRVRTTLLDGETLAWEQTSSSSIILYEEQQLDLAGNVSSDKQYMPDRLVLDESAAHLVAGATWTESYKQLKTPSSKGKATKEQAVWTVESTNDSVTVPAGTYTCIRVTRNHTTSSTPTTTVAWYAAGVGKVKETGAGPSNDQTLELASVSNP